MTQQSNKALNINQEHLDKLNKFNGNYLCLIITFDDVENIHFIKDLRRKTNYEKEEENTYATLTIIVIFNYLTNH